MAFTPEAFDVLGRRATRPLTVKCTTTSSSATTMYRISNANRESRKSEARIAPWRRLNPSARH
jgi:hypothetical protein